MEQRSPARKLNAKGELFLALAQLRSLGCPAAGRKSCQAANHQLELTTSPSSSLAQTHCDIISDFDQDLIDRLTALSEKLDFQIFEDRKFADIGKHTPAQLNIHPLSRAHTRC